MTGLATEAVSVGGATVTALPDSEGPFFLPLSEAFPSVGADVLERAAPLLGAAHFHPAFVTV